MTDSTDEILSELVRIAQTLGPTVEIDRRHPVKAKDGPLIVVRTGDEESATRDTDSPAVWYRRWVMRPTVDVYLELPDILAQRAELNRIWNQFLAEFRKSSICRDLISEKNTPGVARTLLLPNEYAAVTCMQITLEIQFTRA